MAHDKNAWSNHALDHIIPDADRSVYVNSAFQYNGMESNLVQPMSTYLQLGQNNQVLLNHDRMHLMNQHPTPVSPVTVFDPLQNYLDSNETTSFLNESTENQEHPLNIFMASSETSHRKGKQKAKQKKKSDADIVDEDDEEEDEPTIGDGALSCSSNGSRRSENSPLTKEDKRRRNTAASARFRFKKKMREQALQKTACDMTEKTRHMEDRIHDLEREIKWLKALVVEKNDARIEQLIQERPTHIKL